MHLMGYEAYIKYWNIFSFFLYICLVLTQVDNEIPIWICGEPRFVSGITNNTTCSDLIQALIDDELNSSTVGKHNCS